MIVQRDDKQTCAGGRKPLIEKVLKAITKKFHR